MAFVTVSFCANRPEERFCEHIKDDKSEESQKRFILKRDNSSTDKEDNQQNRIHPFRDGRRSKSIEEREEEYQRVRERIFAQDSVCSQENLYVETRILEDCIFNDTQKKRQLFKGNWDGTGKSGSHHSSTETDVKWNGQRPWSSTDSDSSNRNLKPAVTKTASIGGITVLTRGDSTASSRSTGKLSKTGSESSSSGGSSGSLSRVHQSLQSTSLVMSAPVSSAGSVSYPDRSGLSGQVPPNSPSYILVPLEAAGIPPGSILLNPHTGQPFVNPDGTPAIYNPPSGHQPMRSQIAGQSQQQNAPATQQQQPQQPQQQIGSHMVPQSHPYYIGTYQSQPFVNPDGTPAIYNPPSGHQPMRSQIAGQSQQQNAPATQQQQPQQPQQQIGSHMVPQMPVYYYSSGQYPTSASQQYRPVAPVQYNAQRNQQIPQTSQQTGYQTVLPNQQGFQGFMGMQQPPQNQNLMSSQQGNQVQGMLVQYPAISSYQVPMTQSSQGMPPYQQTIMLPSQSGQGTHPANGIPVYCNVLPPSPPSNLRLVAPHCPSNNVPMVPANCRTNWDQCIISFNSDSRDGAEEEVSRCIKQQAMSRWGGSGSVHRALSIHGAKKVKGEVTHHRAQKRQQSCRIKTKGPASTNPPMMKDLVVELSVKAVLETLSAIKTRNSGERLQDRSLQGEVERRAKMAEPGVWISATHAGDQCIISFNSDSRDGAEEEVSRCIKQQAMSRWGRSGGVHRALSIHGAKKVKGQVTHHRAQKRQQSCRIKTKGPASTNPPMMLGPEMDPAPTAGVEMELV
ncbi:UNVERIFIED_CONTAM: hypothetical protein FKN15_042541 [Acipenser sinensis]